MRQHQQEVRQQNEGRSNNVEYETYHVDGAGVKVILSAHGLLPLDTHTILAQLENRHYALDPKLHFNDTVEIWYTETTTAAGNNQRGKSSPNRTENSVIAHHA